VSIPDPEHFVVGRLTDVGQVREINQDYCGEFGDPEHGRRLFVIADGMGGHRGGEVASRIAVETTAEVFEAGGDDPADLLRVALETANVRVHEAAQENRDLAGMGTTGVCLLFETGGRGWVAHVGDSRGYRLRGGDFEQITEDHSVVGALIRMGHITEAEARLHPQRNEILRAIGTNAEVEVQVTPLDLQPGDRYLLCSDGLSGLVTDADIAEVLGRMEPEDAARTLVQMANLAGGSDNITVQVVSIPGEASEPGPGAPPKRQDRSTEVVAPTDLGRHGPPAWVWGVGLGLLGVLGWLLLRR
jgi:protein phosphatase